MGVTRLVKSAVARAALRVAPVGWRRLRFGQWLTRRAKADPRLPRLRFTVIDGSVDPARPHVTVIAREGNSIRIRCDAGLMVRKPNEVFHRVWAPVALIAGAPQLAHAEIGADFSDGKESGPGLLSFCSRVDGAVLIPDHSFVNTRGYAVEREQARANTSDWFARSDTIVWRGTTTGVGIISKPQMAADDPELIARVRLCLALKGVPGTDVRINNIAQSDDSAGDLFNLARAGIFGEYIATVFWNGFRFAIDIDGNSNAWSNLFMRLLMGCCVLKVTSAGGWRQWYYDELKPFEHYVPVKADLSDLLDTIAWCRAHPHECRDIAARGQAFALARDYDTEMAAARARVTQAWAAGLLTRP